MLALFNLASVFGAIVLGGLTDRMHVTSVISISSIGAALAVFLIWGFAINLPVLCLFSLVYGFFAGGYTSTWTGILSELKKKDDRVEVSLIFGVLAAGRLVNLPPMVVFSQERQELMVVHLCRGIGSVVSGPLSEALISGQPWQGKAILGYGSGFGVSCSRSKIHQWL